MLQGLLNSPSGGRKGREMVIMLHLKVFLLPRKEGDCGVFVLAFCCCCFGFLFFVCFWFFFSPFSLSLFPLPLLRAKMMSWTERKYCNGIEGKGRVKRQHNKVTVYNMSINCLNNRRPHHLFWEGVSCIASPPQWSFIDRNTK